MFSVFMWPWFSCVVDAVWALGCAVVGLWWCPACVPCLLAVVVVRSSVRLHQLCVPRICAVLCYSAVCCAALFRCAPLSALPCHTALYVVLHQQGMAATATRATATLFYGGQVPVTSEDLDAATHP